MRQDGSCHRRGLAAGPAHSKSCLTDLWSVTCKVKADAKSQALLFSNRHLRGLLEWMRISSNWGRGSNSETTPPLSSEPKKIEVKTSNDLERVRQVGEYKGRKGYDPEFLGINLPLPTLTDEQFRISAQVAPSNGGNPADKSSAVLNYEHFSIVMNRGRSLLFIWR